MYDHIVDILRVFHDAGDGRSKSVSITVDADSPDITTIAIGRWEAKPRYTIMRCLRGDQEKYEVEEHVGGLDGSYLLGRFSTAAGAAKYVLDYEFGVKCGVCGTVHDIREVGDNDCGHTTCEGCSVLLPDGRLVCRNCVERP